MLFKFIDYIYISTFLKQHKPSRRENERHRSGDKHLYRCFLPSYSIAHFNPALVWALEKRQIPAQFHKHDYRLSWRGFDICRNTFMRW